MEALAQKMTAKSPLGLKLVKQVANQSLDQTEDAALQQEFLTLREYTHSRHGNYAEGLSRKTQTEFKRVLITNNPF